jgi:GTP 3',8-cyclase
MSLVNAPDPRRTEFWSDQLGRPVRDLRMSVTDRCNFRCGYCMPRDKVEASGFLKRSQLLDFEELTRVARVLVDEAGVEKIRITGGEPLMRKQLPRLIEMLAPLGAELAMTTNGVLLPAQAQALRDAGLSRLTVSLDALEDDVFQAACDAPGYAVRDVLAGIEAAGAAGFESIKVNCVVRRGLNESQVLPLARHFSGSNIVLRFIEFMDVGTRNAWNVSEVVTSQEIEQLLAPLGSLEKLAATHLGEVAERYRLGDSGAEVGLISSVTRPFCGDCCRLRLSADGKLHTCLFAAGGTNILGPMREGVSDAQLASLMAELWRKRTDRYSELRASKVLAAEVRPTQTGSAPPTKNPTRLPMIQQRVEMSYIGG